MTTIMPSQFTIRTLTTIQEYRDVEEIQRRAWGMQDNTDVVPLPVLKTAQKNGGLCAGAFDPEGKMVGFVFGFLGMTKHHKFKHCSHMAGVLPDVRRQNTGYHLKLFQRHYVLEQRLDLVTWTYDPMEGLNANLNIAKLGAISRSYYPNHYGDWTDSLNAGIPTDRFEVEWWIGTERVEKFLNGQRQTYAEVIAAGSQLVTQTRYTESGVLELVGWTPDRTDEIILVEIPGEFQAVKRASMDLARAWRQQTAQLFQHYFGRGYSVINFVSHDEDSHRHNFYVLARHVPDINPLPDLESL